MVYTHLIKTEGDKYYSAIAKTTEEAQRLTEDGFSFVCITTEGIMLLENPNRWWVINKARLFPFAIYWLTLNSPATP